VPPRSETSRSTPAGSTRPSALGAAGLAAALRAQLALLRQITSPRAYAALGSAVVAAVALHALQWLLGWGWGSLWAVLSTVIVLWCGIRPWMRDEEGHKHTAALFGAGVGAILGVVYGWLTGGVLSGVLRCASVGTGAAWLGSIRGLTSNAAQAGVVACTLTAFHLLGVLPPSGPGDEELLDRPISDQEYEAIQIGAGKWDVQNAFGYPFLHDVDLEEEKVFGTRGETFGSQFKRTVVYCYRLTTQSNKMAVFVFQGTNARNGSDPRLVDKRIVARPPNK